MITVVRILAFAITSCLVAYDIYVLLLNKTNHTGLPISELTFLVLLTGVASGLLGVVTKKKDWFGVFLLAGVLSINLYGFDRLEIMMNYGDWAERGMPERSRACWFIVCDGGQIKGATH